MSEFYSAWSQFVEANLTPDDSDIPGAWVGVVRLAEDGPAGVTGELVALMVTNNGADEVVRFVNLCTPRGVPTGWGYVTRPTEPRLGGWLGTPYVQSVLAHVLRGKCLTAPR